MFKRANGILYVEYKVDGKTVQKSTRLRDTKEHRLLIKKEVIPSIERKIILGEISGTKAKEFKHYAKVFLRDKEHIKTYDQLESVVQVLNDRFGKFGIDKINRSMVKDFVRDRLEVNTPKTVTNYLTPLRGIFHIAIDDEVIKDNPCANITLPKHQKQSIEPFTSEEVALILDNASDWMRRFLAISFYTGMRTGEVLGLMHSDIDRSNMVINIRRSINRGRVTTPKTKGSIREVPIFEELTQYLQSHGTSLWVFLKDDGSHFGTFAGSKHREWSKLLKKCEIPYRKIYATRHTFIVSMIKNSDLSILEIAQMAGHTSTQMIIQNYGKFIKGEHLKIDRRIRLFTDKLADSISQSS